MSISAQIESLGKFKIHHEVDDGNEVVFRFHPKSKLQGGHAVTVSQILYIASPQRKLVIVVPSVCSGVGFQG